MLTYSFAVPGYAIWGFHIIIGLFFVYLGYLLLNKRKISQLVSISLIIIGVLASAYHTHLLYYYTMTSTNQNRLPIKN